MDEQKKEGEQALRSGFSFTWKAVLVIAAIGLVWLVIAALSHPSHHADATAVGVREETTPPVATNGVATSVSEGATSPAAATPTTTTTN